MEDQSIPYTLLLIPAAPLAAALWLGTCGQWWRRSQAHRPAVFGLLVSFLAAVWLWAGVLPRTFTQAEGQPHAVTSVASVEASAARGVVAHVIYRWVGVGIDRQIPTLSDFKQRQDAGGMSVRMELRADALSALMLVMVTSVSLLVAIFAAGYMHGDPGYPRFFAALSLFVFSMTMLVLSGNYLQLFIFWEGVGLCSYLLIGYWFHRPSAAAAAMKAFVVNRVGDLGLILGIFLIWTTFGTLDFDLILSDHTRIHNLLAIDPTLITTICLLLLIGAIGKSAQFPLHVWLPDAMEGPTPVSALIHAATMVTAGVYLVARSAPLFAQSSYALHMVAGVGAITALIAAISALAQYDLKRVLAYSTISQLGYMFMGLGAAGADPKHLMPLALASAMFHLFTHAYFKAVLFLSAGSVMHAMGDVIDMRRFSGLRHALPITHGAFLAGALALAGIPLLSGFWSKDEIVSLLWTAAQTEDGWFYRCVWGSAVVTALLTAFYSMRAYYLTFWGPERFPSEAGEHPHDAPPSMAGPLLALSVAAVAIGLITGPTQLYASYLLKTPGIPGEHHPHHGNLHMMLLSSVLAGVGLTAAWRLYGRRGDPARVPAAPGFLESCSLHGLYWDQILTRVIVRPLQELAQWLAWIDLNLLDGLIDTMGLLPRWLGALLRPLQQGLVPHYALAMLCGVLLGLWWMWQGWSF